MRTPIVNAISLLAVAGVVTVAAAFRHAPGHITAHATASSRASRATVTAPVQAGDSLSAAADANRTDGSATSKVWVVEISDLQCPFCKRWHDEVFPKVRDEYIKTGKIRFAYVNFPLAQHENAFPAATAAMCASAQGKFWQMHDALFSTQEKWEALSNPNAYFESLASKAGIDMPRWKSCLSAPSIKALIQADRYRADRAGVQSTPSFIIANKLIGGAMPWNDMKKAIDQALAAAQ